MRLLPVVVLVACAEVVPDEVVEAPPIDLSVPLGPSESRAAVITDPAVLLGGAAAEGQVGDLMLLNDRVRFVVQAVREGGGLLHDAGGVIDADIVRPAGQPGRDLVMDFAVMADVGHMSAADTVEVLDDGVDSGTAIVRVTGEEAPFAYLNGAFEDPGFVADFGLVWQTDYILEAGTPLLRVETTATAADQALSVQLGDGLLTIPGIGSIWAPGAGRTDSAPAGMDRILYADDEHGLVVGMLGNPAEGTHGPNRGLDLFNFLISIASLQGDAVDIPAGGSVTYTRWYGAAEQVGTLTDAWAEATGLATSEVSATVMAPDGPVAGARVTFLVDGSPWTMVVSDAEGVATAQLPQTGTITVVADGSGSRLHRDLPAGAGRFGPFSGADAQAVSLASMADGAPGLAHARGRGRAEGPPGTLMLGEPGYVALTAADGLPFEVQLRAVGAELVDDGLGWEVPYGLAALGWPRQGALTIPLEPGTYDVLVHRGVRWEALSTQVTLAAGETTEVAVDLDRAVTTPGWFTVDSHTHAAPSPDGKISMTDRVLVSAAVGVQVHLGTEHDVVVDYTALVKALGVDHLLTTFPATEVSPILRGHANMFPLVAEPAKPNGGAYLWWRTFVDDTVAHFTNARAAQPGGVVQINHPFSPGMPALAGWSEGVVADPDFWYDGFDALEVVKGNSNDQEIALLVDLVNRGIVPAVMGNTDSHDHRQNNPGINVTWVYLGEDAPGDITPEAFAEAIRQRRTVGSNGPFLDLSVLPGSTLTEATELVVSAEASPSWVVVDTLQLLKDGVVVQEVSGRTATFQLDGDADASFMVAARGSTSEAPVTGYRPFALTSPILLDVDGDGWDAPLPPLQLGEGD